MWPQRNKDDRTRDPMYEDGRATTVTEDTTRASSDADDLRVRRDGDLGDGPVLAERAVPVETPYIVRGGLALGSVFTGMLVAFGAMFILSALFAGILTAIGLTTEGDVNTGSEVLQLSIGAGIALVVAQFLAYYWGGYTAGRMARGAGGSNGILVPVTAIVFGVVVVAVVYALGANANLNMPFQTSRLPVEEDVTIRYGIGLGIISLVAMLAGGLLGGIRGARWHTRLEDPAIDHPRGRRVS